MVEVDMLFIDPKSGVFDTSIVEKLVLENPYVLRDPLDPTTFIICRNTGSMEYALYLRIHRPHEGYPWLGLVKVLPTRITVGYQCREEIRPVLNRIVAAILRRYQCVVEDDYGRDLTSQAYEIDAARERREKGEK